MNVAVGADFETLFRAQFPRLVSIGLAMTRDRDAAVDLAQEALARAHVRWDEVGTMEYPEAWLRRVVTNLAIDRSRRRERERRAIGRLALARQRSSDPADATDAGLGPIVASLPPRQRAVVVLRYLEDLPIAEIADELDIAVGTVKATLFKARANMADRLGMEHPDG